MNDMEKEHLLHKIIAASAFLFALMILPVAQYLLVSNKLPADKGQVAGVSTDQSVTQANVPNPEAVAACETKKQQDLADLDRFEQGKKQAMLTDYEASVAQFKQVEPTLQGAEKDAVDKLIDDQYQPYLKKLAAVQQAVDTDRQSISSRNCSSQ